MSTEEAWEGVTVLIPKHVHQARREAIQAACLDMSALVEALPSASPSSLDAALSNVLAHADADYCKAWIMRAIRALPTQADMEAAHGNA